MKQRIVKYIEDFNKVARVTIEYAAIEPFFSSSGKILYNLHLIYSPSAEYIVNDYLRGTNANEMFHEKVIKSAPALKECMLKFETRARIENTSSQIPIDDELFSLLATTVISNVGRFYNFTLTSPTDPFFTMFLEEDSIVYASDRFKTVFLDHKSIFRPSTYAMVDILHSSFVDYVKKSGEYGIYSNKDKYTELLVSTNKAVKLYFVALKYAQTGEFRFSHEEHQLLILNTLAQASKPWEYINQCIVNLERLRRELYEENITAIVKTSSTEEKEAIRKACFNFLTQRLIGELNA